MKQGYIYDMMYTGFSEHKLIDSACVFVLRKKRKGGIAMLNPKQKRFADEYLIDLNATQAALRAGYAEKTAYSQGQRLLKNVEISSYVAEQLETIHNKKTADAQEVMEYLTSVMRGEHKEQVLRLIGEGYQEISSIDVSAKDRLKAAELIGKRYAMFTDKTDLNGALPVIISGGEALAD